MQKILTVSNSASSTLHGNVAQALKEIIIRKFPKEYFNYISISSELATRNTRRLFGNNNSMELRKREKPLLIIQPTYITSPNDVAFHNTPLVKNNYDMEYGIDAKSLFPLMNDPNNDYRVLYKMNREKMEFEVTLTVTTLHQQIDIYKMMQNQILWENSGSKELPLEASIPLNIIRNIGKITNIDIDDNDENIPVLLRNLNNNSLYPITYKIRNASSRKEFFMYYNHNVIITFTELSTSGSSREGMIENNFNITFRVIAEFNIPSVFFILGNPDKEYSILGDIEVINQLTDTQYIPLFTITNMYSKFPDDYKGLRLHSIVAFQTDLENAPEDIVDLKEIYGNEYVNIIRDYKKYNIPMDTLFDTIIYSNESLLVKDKDYKIDYNTISLILIKPHKLNTYRIASYINLDKINEILDDTEFNRNYDIHKLDQNPTIEYEPNLPDITDPPIEVPTDIINDDTSVPDTTSVGTKKFQSSVNAPIEPVHPITNIDNVIETSKPKEKKRFTSKK